MMSEQQAPNSSIPTQPPNSKEAWEEVGKQFETLGKSIAECICAAWQDPNNRAELEKIKASIKQMADDVEKAVSQAASFGTGQKFKGEAEKAAQSLADSARETYEEVKPQVANALKQAGDELHKLVNKIEGNDKNRAWPLTNLAQPQPRPSCSCMVVGAVAGCGSRRSNAWRIIIC